MLEFAQQFFFSTGPEFEPSKILLDNKKYWELLKSWLEPASTLPSKWKLCYRARDHGWSSSTFHSQCDGLGPTVTFVRVGEYIFGGYTDRNWRKFVYYNKLGSLVPTKSEKKIRIVRNVCLMEKHNDYSAVNFKLHLRRKTRVQNLPQSILQEKILKVRGNRLISQKNRVLKSH